MLNKIKELTKKQWLIIMTVVILTASIVAGICLLCSRDTVEPSVLTEIKDLDVTAEEMEEYRKRIGTDMDIKKAYLILFENEESCREFIAVRGADEDPTAAGIGIIPYMEHGYYNIVGKQSLEDAFDLLKDGEYSEEPIVYSNMYCYLKRIGVDSILENDEELKALIRNEKYLEKRKTNE